MADPLTLIRREGAFDYDLRPGEYRQVLRKHMYGSLAYVIWRCPGCSELTSLTRSTHSIDYEGVVAPLTQCPHEPCSRLYQVTLADWFPETGGKA